MNKIIFIFSLFLVCSIPHLDSFPPPGGTGIKRLRSNFNPPPLELIHQGFEGTGYDHTLTEYWTDNSISGAVSNPDFAGPFSDGSECLLLTNNCVVNGSWLGGYTNKDEIFGYVKILVVNTNLDNVLILSTLDNVSHAYVAILSSSRVQITDSVGGTTATTADGVGTNTITHIFFHWNHKDGSGDVAFSTDGTKPISGTKFTSFINGTTGSKISGLQLACSNANHTNLYDHVRVSDLQRYSDNPP